MAILKKKTFSITSAKQISERQLHMRHFEEGRYYE